MEVALLVLVGSVLLYLGLRVLRTLMGVAGKVFLLALLACGAWFLYHLITT